MMAQRFNEAQGPAVVLVPTRGFSYSDRPSHPFYDPDADAALVAALEANLDAEVELLKAAALGITEPLPARDLSSKKSAMYAVGENRSSLGRVTGFCYFGPAPRSFIQVDEVVSAVRAATGWEVSVQDLARIGERATNLAHVFNIREGFSRKDDTLSDRLFGPLENSPLAGVGISREEFERAMTDLYIANGA